MTAEYTMTRLHWHVSDEGRIVITKNDETVLELELTRLQMLSMARDLARAASLQRVE